MQTKDVTKMLGIDRDRIKYFKKQGVFVPEHSSTGNNSTYTEHDVELLKKLIVLTKSGLTCGDIKKVQEGVWTLEEAFHNRRKLIQEEMARMEGALHLSEEMLNDGIQYNSMATEHYWNVISLREQEGEKFMDIDDMHYRPVPFTRTISCPHCGTQHEVDLEDFIYDETCNESRFDDDMGPDIVYSFDSEDGLECEHCRKQFKVSGWIREYPIGAYDSEDIDIQAL